MYPVTFFYFLIAKNVKESLDKYYQYLNIEFTSKVYYTHLRMFAISMVDRFISKIHPEDYEFRYETNEVPAEILASGCVLVYSHFGGWGASTSGSHVKNKINIVMQEAMLVDIKSIEKNLELESKVNVIELPPSILRLNELARTTVKSTDAVCAFTFVAANIISAAKRIINFFILIKFLRFVKIYT